MNCPQCQASITEGQRFCRFCGFRLDEGIQDYVPTAVYDKHTSPMTPPSENSSYASWSPLVASSTTPLATEKKRSRFHWIVLSVILAGIIVVGGKLYERSERESAGVDPRYIEDIRSATDSMDMTVDELVQMKIHGVDPAYVKAMMDAGFQDLTMDDLVALKLHGVNAEFAQEVKAAGLTEVSADDLVELKLNGITPEFVKEVMGAGVKNPDIEDLVTMKHQGIDPSSLKKWIQGKEAQQPEP